MGHTVDLDLKSCIPYDPTNATTSNMSSDPGIIIEHFMNLAPN